MNKTAGKQAQSHDSSKNKKQKQKQKNNLTSRFIFLSMFTMIRFFKRYHGLKRSGAHEKHNRSFKKKNRSKRKCHTLIIRNQVAKNDCDWQYCSRKPAFILPVQNLKGHHLVTEVSRTKTNEMKYENK